MGSLEMYVNETNTAVLVNKIYRVYFFSHFPKIVNDGEIPQCW